MKTKLNLPAHASSYYSSLLRPTRFMHHTLLTIVLLIFALTTHAQTPDRTGRVYLCQAVHTRQLSKAEAAQLRSANPQVLAARQAAHTDGKETAGERQVIGQQQREAKWDLHRQQERDAKKRLVK